MTKAVLKKIIKRRDYFMVEEQFNTDSFFLGGGLIWLIFAIILLALICPIFRPFPGPYRPVY